MNDSFKTYLLSVGLDPDEICDYWAERMEKGINEQYHRAVGKSLTPSLGFKMRPLTYDEIINSETSWMKDEYTKMLGKEVFCDYSDKTGRFVGMFTDEMDYYYGVYEEGELVYHSCVGGIMLVNDL